MQSCNVGYTVKVSISESVQNSCYYIDNIMRNDVRTHILNIL